VPEREEGNQPDSGAPRLYVIAGPNGAGKSTPTRALVQSGGPLAEDVPVVNPDVIAREMRPERSEDAAFEAGREALRRRSAFLEERPKSRIVVPTNT
jgi:predicted ABC-type ATPase